LIDIFTTVIDNFGDAGYSLRLAKYLNENYEKTRILTDNKEIFFQLDDQILFDVIEMIDLKDDYKSSEKIIFMFQFFPEKIFLKSINKNKSKCITIDYFTPEKWAVDSNNTQAYHKEIKTKNIFLVPGIYEKSAGILKYIQTEDKKNNFHNIYLYSPEKICAFLKEEIILWGNKDILATNIKKMPILPQKYFDSYLIGAKFNWIRGEDSFQLALNSGIPFFWEAYKQKNKVHHLKVTAYLNFMKNFFDSKEIYNNYKNIILYLNDYDLKIDFEKNFMFLEREYIKLQKVFISLKEYFQKIKSLQENLIENFEIM